VTTKNNRQTTAKATRQVHNNLPERSINVSASSCYTLRMSTRVALTDAAKAKLARWYAPEVLANARILRGSVFGWVFGRFGQAGVTINRTVHLTPRAMPELESARGLALIGHELFHVAQQQEMGWWRYLARYVWRWRPKHISRGHEHPMEAPAYARGAEIRRALEKLPHPPSPSPQAERGEPA
jgi:hypothetical protein